MFSSQTTGLVLTHLSHMIGYLVCHLNTQGGIAGVETTDDTFESEVIFEFQRWRLITDDYPEAGKGSFISFPNGSICEVFYSELGSG